MPTAPPARTRLAPHDVMTGYSLEITAKDIESLEAAAASIAPGTQVAVTFLPGETMQARVAAAVAVRRLGFEPMPHFSARRIIDKTEFADYLARVTGEAGATRCFVIAGDLPKPDGPFAESLDMIETGLFERHGIASLGIAGHPGGHPNMTEEDCNAVLARKCEAITARGMSPQIVTQFGFDAAPFLSWLEHIRAAGIDAPARIGMPGPAGIRTLLRFAARCGVEASTSVMAKYGVSIASLLGSAGPDKLADALASNLSPELGEVTLHFYPFGGLQRTVDWINGYASRG